ncbi:MAG TPA: hypothetical protein VME01_08480 [Solirubrobacteraceae bacterium]|nr:hypothetical protein [Solirubrobacteraceae bacterium]
METLLQRNRLSFIAIAVVAAYVAIAMTTRFVVLGILPVMLSVRAFRRGEMLAPLALAGAAVAVVVAIVTLSHH